MNAYDSLPDGVTQIFGEEAVADLSYDVLTVDVPVGSWIPALETARDKLGCTYFDWLSAVDEPGTGFRVCAHVVALEGHRVRRLLLRTTVPHAAPSLPSAVTVYAGASWHERETHEMFGVVFTDHPHLVPLLLPENFEGHPLRKDFVLAARVAKAWPGAKEPGEGHDAGGPKRRTMLPPGVPDPNDWGPLKGQLPPAPARPARTPRAAGDRPARTPREGAPARRTRTVAEGSASQTPEPLTAEGTPPEGTPTGGAPAAGPARPARRTRTAAEGSASQTAEPAPAEGTPTGGAPAAGPARPARRTRTAAEGSASQTAEPAPAEGAPAAGPARPARRTRTAAEGSASQTGGAAQAGQTPPADTARPQQARRSTDAPWHNPKPAFGEPPPAEPRRPAPAQTEPAQAEPTQAEPQAEPAKAEPTPADTDTDTDNGGDA
ncbi:NADH-quinone oxidoreductase subunit C [Streptomyces sp. NPDC012888]|uniref:NADH-quinone oxidoreductase subunit C n=1 Tax=Streptomyces sp. NPDC012888 TaxID=3364855 RepID=UPI00368B1112